MFKILSWNINGLRSQKSDLKTLLDDLQADIICLQETKITRDQLEEALAIVDGYYSFFSFSRKRTGYSGVVTYCKKDVTPSYAQEGLGGTLGVGSLSNHCGLPDSLLDSWDNKELRELDAEGRCIITQHEFQDENGSRKTLSLINVYCPRADPDRPDRAVFKLSFYELLRQRASMLRKDGSQVIIVGDVNTSHKRIDHCDPDEDQDFETREDRIFLDDFFLDTSSRTPTQCNHLQAPDEDDDNERIVSKKFKVVDTFRHFHPEQREAFTCWCTMVNARATNYGTRIDYILCNEETLLYVDDSFIHPDIHGSDHCPVSINLSKLRFLSADAVPSMCTKFYREFHGSQQKLSSYFKANTDVSKCMPIHTHTLDEKVKRTENGEPHHTKRKLDAKGGGLSVNSKRKNMSSGKQSTLNSYFIKRSNSQNLSNLDSESGSFSVDGSASSEISDSSNSVTSTLEDTECNVDNVDVESEEKTRKATGTSSSSSNWGFLMKGPAPPPLCSGHKEPSVLRIVKKKGPNLNKQFYACARGVGKEGDPNSQCNSFKWVNNKSK